MGRPKLGEEYKKPSDYSYDFPEQREFSEGLILGDIKIIADKLIMSDTYVGLMVNGKRKMTQAIRDEVLRLTELNKLKVAI